MLRQFAAAFACGSLLLLAAACDGPTGADLDRVGDDSLQGGAPATVTFAPATFDTDTVEDVTGDRTRILAGTVEDPVAGTITSLGYVDVAQPSEVPNAYEQSTIRAVRLEFALDGYVYGDTTQSVTFELRNIPSDWTSSGVSSDTSRLPTGQFSTRFTVSPTDSIATVTLPDGWRSAIVPTLQDTSNFNPDGQDDAFHGFAIEPVAGQSVVGIDLLETEMRAITPTDSAAFGGVRSLSVLERTSVPDLANHVTVQDGFGQVVDLSFDREEPPLDSLRGAPVNRFELSLPTDSTFVQQNTPESFVRPAPSRLVFLGVQADSSNVALPFNSDLDPAGRVVFGNSPAESNTARQLLQELLAPDTSPRFERFRLRLAPTSNTINLLVLRALSNREAPPQAALTVTPI
jgi:hypothetical protein